MEEGLNEKQKSEKERLQNQEPMGLLANYIKTEKQEKLTEAQRGIQKYRIPFDPAIDCIANTRHFTRERGKAPSPTRGIDEDLNDWNLSKLEGLSNISSTVVLRVHSMTA